LTTKLQVWAFGINLGWIWLFQLFGYLGIWAEKQIMAGIH
jgi:hypothetical protein